jgi:solute carrier family 36 (proton-coupled amino acid transporter)
MNGGWAFALGCMGVSFYMTYFCLIKLLQAREKVTGGSFSEIAEAAMGKPGRYVLDLFLSLMLYGFVIALAFFTIINLKNVVDGILEQEIPEWYLGKKTILIYFLQLGVFLFVVTAPLCFVRRIEKFAFTYIIADFLILITAITIVVFAGIHISEKEEGWGDGVPILNQSTWLTMIGSSIYSFEGIGCVIPVLEVTANPKKFPRLLLYVMMTSLILFTGFGEFCLFVYGKELEGKPLITMNLPDGPVIWILKSFFSINVIISISLCAFPANNIIESYIFAPSTHKETPMRYWLTNLFRSVLIAVSIGLCISMGTALDKFNSIIGTVTATPVVFMIPCIAHYKLCSPTPGEKFLDIIIVAIAMIILVYCTTFTVMTWND